MQGLSPIDFTNWNHPISLYFEDAVHVEPDLSANLNFWKAHLVHNGIICGHDYADRFPDVQNAVNIIAQEMGRDLHLVESLWYVLPDEITCSENQRTKEVLKMLKAAKTDSILAR